MEDNGNSIRVEHVLVITLDAAVARIADSIIDIAREAVHSGRIVAYGLSVFFVLYGASRYLPGMCRNRRRIDNADHPP
jgi:excinuclease UvrABC ATPase subunit